MDCMVATGPIVEMGCDGKGDGSKRVWGLRVIGSAVKEGGGGGNVAVDGKEFGEEVGRVDEAGKEDKAKELLTGPLLHPVLETHVDRLELLWSNRGSRKTDLAFVVDE